MTCEICGKNATFFFKQTKNGYTVEKALCSECANKSGLSNPSSLFDAIQDDFFGGLLTSFVNKEPKLVSTKSCSGCGMTLGELLNGGKVGCAKCYSVFEKSLVPTIAKIHGNVVHCGKFPETHPDEALKNYNENKEPEKAQLSEKEQTMILKKQLKTAVDNQEYELAAKLRDEIKSLEEKLSQNENEEGGEK